MKRKAEEGVQLIWTRVSEAGKAARQIRSRISGGC